MDFWTFGLLAITLLLSGCGASPSLVSIQITPDTASIVNSGGTVQFTAMGTYSRGKHPSETRDVTSLVTWSSSNTGTATISNSGVATAVSSGTTSITATMNSSNGLVSANASLDVSLSGSGGGGGGGTNPSRELTGITLIPNGLSVPSGNTAQIIALGNFNANPTTQILTTQVTWRSSDASVATISTSGLVTTLPCPTSSCETIITATYQDPIAGDIVSTPPATITVNSVSPPPPPPVRTLLSLAIVPTSQNLNLVGETTQFLAIGIFNVSPTTQDVSGEVLWKSSDASVATIDSSGLATGVGVGSATITASWPAGGVTPATATISEAGNTPNPTPSLTISVVGTGTGAVASSPGGITACTSSGGTCSSQFVLGSSVTLTATPSGGSTFAGWSSNCTPVVGNPNQCTITMGGNQSVGAIFN